MTTATLSAPIHTPESADLPEVVTLYRASDTDGLTRWVALQMRDIFQSLQYYPQPPVLLRDRLTGKQARWAGCYSYLDHIILNRAAFDPLHDNPEAQDRALRSVLLHELCHHIVRWDEIQSDLPPSPAHGAAFRTAMRTINAHFQDDLVSVYHTLQIRTISPQMQRRALAMLALTTSSNEHEAALAAARFAEFQLRYEVNLSPEAEALRAGLPSMDDQVVHVAKQASTWLRYLLSGIADTHACKLYWRRERECVQFHLVGRETKISQAYDVLDYLIEAIDKAVAKERKEAKASGKPYRQGRSYFMAFREGVALAVAVSLRERHKQRMAEGITGKSGCAHIPGLVLQDHFKKEEAAMEEYLKTWSYGFKASSTGGSRSAAGRFNGHAAGRAIGVDPQVRSGSRSARALPSGA